MNVSQIALIGGMILTALTILSNVVIAWINKNNEFKKELHKTIIDCAYKEWVETSKRVTEIAKNEGKRATIYPFTDYLLYYNRLIKILNKKSLSIGRGSSL
jgi:hypothetical protein